MNLNNPPKFVGVLMAMVLLTVVFGIDKLTEAAYVGLMGMLVGYLVGNGIAARQGEVVEPVLAESPAHAERRHQLAADLDPLDRGEGTTPEGDPARYLDPMP